MDVLGNKDLLVLKFILKNFDDNVYKFVEKYNEMNIIFSIDWMSEWKLCICFILLNFCSGRGFYGEVVI